MKSAGPPVVVMGVSGCGKSTLGRALAMSLGARFVEGDELHPTGNIAKMSSGIPLTDMDRLPWLEAIGAELAKPKWTVASCSSLKKSYRDILRRCTGPGLRFVFMNVPRDKLEARLVSRKGHYMGVSLLDSQLAALEIPRNENGVLALDGTLPISALTATIIAWL